jgi:hypothetical protein
VAAVQLAAVGKQGELDDLSSRSSGQTHRPRDAQWRFQFIGVRGKTMCISHRSSLSRTDRGRETRDGKRGSIPSRLAPILIDLD